MDFKVLQFGHKKDYPAFYKAARAVLLVFTWLIALLFIGYLTWFLVSGPLYTLMEDLTFSTALEAALLIVVLISLFVAFKRHIIAGGFAMFITAVFVVLRSVAAGKLQVGALEITLLVLGGAYVALGLFKKWWDDEGSDSIIGPDIEKFKGPDIRDMKL